MWSQRRPGAKPAWAESGSTRAAGPEEVGGSAGALLGAEAPRGVVDYALKRRALLHEVYAGRVSRHEVCDASPYLRNAARFHGEPTEERCPICRRENLTLVHYVYGDELRQSAGQARARAELPALAARLRELQVFVVEVCRGCDWNLLVQQYVLGRGGAPDAAGERLVRDQRDPAEQDQRQRAGRRGSGERRRARA